jgi:hypothetical protein
MTRAPRLAAVLAAILATVLAASLAAVLGPTVPAAAQAPAAPKASPLWQVTVTQIDRSGTVVGNPQSFPCPKVGCEQFLKLDVAGTGYNFLASLTFIPRGAYFALSSMQQDIRKVVEFEKGYEGPLFLQARPGTPYAVTLNFVLTGLALADDAGGGPQLTDNTRSLVFHRKLYPDLTLRIEMEPAGK